MFTDRNGLQGSYVDAVIREIGRAAESGARFDTVFVGGGTPSLLPPILLASVLRTLPFDPGTEISVECNPDDVTDELVTELLSAGLTRLSLGVQSTSNHVLANIGRTHDADAVGRAVEIARRCGVTSLNLDLIYGASNESMADWERTLADAVSFGSTHLSAYALTVEGGTALAHDPDRRPDEDDQADKYERTHVVLGAAGFANYEVSNWARPGYECAHNWRYWRQGEYLGFGCAAHSHLGGRRWWNVRTPDRYIEKISHGSGAESASEFLSPPERALEAKQLLLRTREGVSDDSFTADDLTELVEGGLVDRAPNGRVVLTVAGRLMANAVSHLLRVAA